MRNALNENVLVLNRLWQAINVCSVERAFTLLYMGHAEVVVEEGGNFQTFDFQEWRDVTRDHAGEDVVRTISFNIRIPRVILLLFFDRLPHKEVKFTRHNIFERDRNTCQYCAKPFDRRELNLDHIIPRERGGTTTWENIVCACIPCNTRKANRTPTETEAPQVATIRERYAQHGHARQLEAFPRLGLLERGTRRRRAIGGPVAVPGVEPEIADSGTDVDATRLLKITCAER